MSAARVFWLMGVMGGMEDDVEVEGDAVAACGSSTSSSSSSLERLARPASSDGIGSAIFLEEGRKRRASRPVPVRMMIRGMGSRLDAQLQQHLWRSGNPSGCKFLSSGWFSTPCSPWKTALRRLSGGSTQTGTSPLVLARFGGGCAVCAEALFAGFAAGDSLLLDLRVERRDRDALEGI